MLTQENWAGADLVAIVAEAIAPFGSSSDARFRVEGPPVRLTAPVALSLAMTLHELSSNAVKYGALSVPDEQVAII